MRWAMGKPTGSSESWGYWDQSGVQIADVIGRPGAWRWAIGVNRGDRPLFGGGRSDLDFAKTAVEVYVELFRPILGALWIADIDDELELTLEGIVLAKVIRNGCLVHWAATESGLHGVCSDLDDACLFVAKEAALHRSRRLRPRYP